MRRSCRVGLLAVLVATAMTPALAVSAQEPPRGATRVAPGGTTRVYVLAAFDRDCRSLPRPAIVVTTPPAKGEVSFREGQSVVVQQSLSGQCLGSRVSGTGIYYTAKPGAAGPDSFAIQATLATGEVASRTFSLDIREP